MTVNVTNLSEPNLDDGVFDDPAPVAPGVAEEARRGGGGLKAGKRAPGIPSDAPIAALADADVQVPQWRTYRVLPGGTRSYIGDIPTNAQPGDVIEAFPADMPPAGANWTYVFVGVDQMGVDTDNIRTFTISGNNPTVLAARATIAPDQRRGSTDERAFSSLERQVQDERDTIKAERARLLIEQREAADRARGAEEQRHRGQVDWLSQMSAAERARHETAMTEERERRADERKDRAEERKAEAERRAEDRKADAEARRQEAADRRTEEQARERDRERREDRERDAARAHEAHLATLRANSGLAGLVPLLAPLVPLLTALPLRELASRALGLEAPRKDEDDDGTPQGTVQAVAGVLQSAIETGGRLMEKNLEMQTRAAAAGQIPAPRPRPALPGPLPTPLPRPAGPGLPTLPPAAAPAPAAPPTPAPAPPTPAPPSAVAASVALIPARAQREARGAIRRLSERLVGEPDQSKWRAMVFAAAATTPAMQPYVEAVGLRAALLEAGTPEPIVALLEAAAKAEQAAAEAGKAAAP